MKAKPTKSRAGAASAAPCTPGPGFRKLKLDEPMQAGDLWLVGVVRLDEEARKKYTMAELRNLAVPEWVPIPDIPRMVGKSRRQYAANFETPIEPPDIFRANDQAE